jgi:hypothetical protein
MDRRSYGLGRGLAWGFGSDLGICVDIEFVNPVGSSPVMQKGRSSCYVAGAVSDLA